MRKCSRRHPEDRSRSERGRRETYAVLVAVVSDRHRPRRQAAGDRPEPAAARRGAVPVDHVERVGQADDDRERTARRTEVDARREPAEFEADVRGDVGRRAVSGRASTWTAERMTTPSPYGSGRHSRSATRSRREGVRMTIRVSCVGDSITRAQHSVDYTSLLRARHRPGEVRTQHFGVNRDSPTTCCNGSTRSWRHRPCDHGVDRDERRPREPARLPGRQGDAEQAAADQAVRGVVPGVPREHRRAAELGARRGDRAPGLPVLGRGPAAGAGSGLEGVQTDDRRDAEISGVAYLRCTSGRWEEEVRREEPGHGSLRELTVAGYLGTVFQRKLLGTASTCSRAAAASC